MRVETNGADETELRIQYQNLEQQEEASTLGMWIFLATEVLFFGGLFLSYTVYRITYPDTFARAGRELNITIGTINTALLLLSSYFMAIAVRAVKCNKNRVAAFCLGGSWLLGFTFLILKAYEYHDDVQKHIVATTNIVYAGANVRVARMFYFIYYSMTGLHAIHMVVGLGLIAVVFSKVVRNQYSSTYNTPLVVSGLYWHFIDVIWIFLYPLLYLMGRYL
jgi:cytochrome c oxidase subunit 3